MADPITIRRTELDGVPCFWADPGEDQDTLGLLFRVGLSDERLPHAGITHLVEHLALNTLDPAPYAWNGFVDLTHCGFLATGKPEELVRFAAQVCRALGDLPTDRLDRERQVLRTEAASRWKGPFAQLLHYRFGAARHGLVIMPEWGLWTATMEEAQRWSRDRFTRQNASVWYVGRLPSDLQLPLPDGVRRPPVEPAPISPLPLPSAIGVEQGSLALGGICRRSRAANHAVSLVAEALMARLRSKEGVAREIHVDYVPLNAETAHVAWGVPLLKEHANAVRTGFLDVLQGLATGGPSAEALERTKERERRNWSGRRVAYGATCWQAREILMGGRIVGPEELHAESEAVSADMVRSAVSEVLDSAILVLPAGTEPPGEPFLEYPTTSVERVAGAKVYRLARPEPGPDAGFRERYMPWSLRRPEWPRLILGSNGVSLCLDPCTQVTVRNDACAGYVVGTEGARTLISLDGFKLNLIAGAWIHGNRLIQDLDRIFPPECRINL
jgi:predicted Zn-dependent peptidase